jgi:hypothetical protein
MIADFVVVGGGIGGTVLAELPGRGGKKVVVLGEELEVLADCPVGDAERSALRGNIPCMTPAGCPTMYLSAGQLASQRFPAAFFLETKTALGCSSKFGAESYEPARAETFRSGLCLRFASRRAEICGPLSPPTTGRAPRKDTGGFR